MERKGQISFFLIIGFIILMVFVVGYVFILNSSNKKIVAETGYLADGDSKAVKLYVNTCLKNTLIDAAAKVGIKQDDIEKYLDENLKACLKFNSFKGLDVEESQYKSHVMLNDLKAYASLDNNLVISKGASSVDVSGFAAELGISKNLDINQDSVAGTEVKTVLISSDNKARLVIPGGTRITDATDNYVSSLKIEIVDKGTIGLGNNDGMISQLVYSLEPDGAKIQPPMPLVIEYDKKLLPKNIAEDSLKIFVFNKATNEWEPMPTVVDKEIHTLTAMLEHFSFWGAGSSCGNGKCESFEDYAFCPQDCTQPSCGNLVCDQGETSINCPNDCPNQKTYTTSDLEAIYNQHDPGKLDDIPRITKSCPSQFTCSQLNNCANLGGLSSRSLDDWSYAITALGC